MRVQVSLMVKAAEEVHSTFEIAVGASDKVGDIKRRVAELQSIPFPEQDLVFDGRVLDDGQPLNECGVKEGSTLVITFSNAEAGFLQILKELRGDTQMAVEELAAMYAYKFGVSVGETLRTLGYDGKLQDFLDQQKSHVKKSTNEGTKKPCPASIEDAPARLSTEFTVNVRSVVAERPMAIIMSGEAVVNAAEVVSCVKERFANLHMVPFPDQDLILDGRVLEGEQRLSDCGIKQGSSLDLVVRGVEASLIQQLSELLKARDLPAGDLGMLYSCRHGITINDALRIAGHHGKLQDFLGRHGAFRVSGGCVTLVPEARRGIPEEPATTGAVDGGCGKTSDRGALERTVLEVLDDVVDILSGATFLNIHRIAKRCTFAVPEGENDAEAVFFLRGLPFVGQSRWLPPLLKAVAAILEQRLDDGSCNKKGSVCATSDTVQIRTRGDVMLGLRFSPADKISDSTLFW